jgi:hypothetical protein
MKLCLKVSLLVVCFCLLCPPISWAKDAPSSAAPKVPALAEGEQLAHPIVRGSLGPWKSVSVVLVEHPNPNRMQFRGRVVVPQAAGGATVFTLPIPEDIGAVMEQHAKAVMFRRIDRSNSKSLIVLYESYRSGSGEPGSTDAYVFRWDGQQFVAVEDVRKKLMGATNSKAIDRRLAAIVKADR